MTMADDGPAHLRPACGWSGNDVGRVMSDPVPVWTFQALRVEYNDEPLRVLEERRLPAGECTLEAARLMFMRRFEDPEYARMHGVPKLEAVRFLDQNDGEVLRYTLYRYYRDLVAREATAVQDT
jgi:hypothetical protein